MPCYKTSSEMADEMAHAIKTAEEIYKKALIKAADHVIKKLNATVPHEKLKGHMYRSKVYKTADGSLNIKVYCAGYVTFSGNRKWFLTRNFYTSKGVPAPFLVKIFEFGRSNSPFTIKPFFRRAFNHQQIENIILKEQKELSKGLLGL